jgi:hypothetical protein
MSRVSLVPIALLCGITAAAAPPTESELNRYVTALRAACFQLAAEASRECLRNVKEALYPGTDALRDDAWLREHFVRHEGRPVIPERRPPVVDAAVAQALEGTYGHFDLKGLRMGQPEVLVAHHLGRDATCRAEDGTRLRTCAAALTFGGINTTAVVTMIEGKAVSIVIVCPTEDFLLLNDGMKRKFGPPTSERVESLENRMGAEFTSRVTTWEAHAELLRVSERSEKVDRMSIQLVSAQGLQLLERERARRADAAAQDM